MYDPKIGKWLSADPIGFEGEDANLYRYVGNGATAYLDPLGFSELTATVEDEPTFVVEWGSSSEECPECPCIGGNHDCEIVMVTLEAGESIGINIIREDGERMHHVERIESTHLSHTYVGPNGGRQFSEHVAAFFVIYSASGKDVSNCHLAQTVVNRLYTTEVGRTVDIGEVPEDISSGDVGTNLAYGGSWFYDIPGVFAQQLSNSSEELIVGYFWQARVYIEEDSDTQVYWGFERNADFSNTQPNNSAPVSGSQWGPITDPKHAPSASC